MTTIRVNNQVITIANKSTESSTFNIDKESKALESLAINIEKSIETLNIVSNIKAMESFGYKSTEGVGENIKAGIKNIWEKIKQFFIKIGRWIKDMVLTGGAKTRAAALLKKVEVMDENDINFDFKMNPVKLQFKMIGKHSVSETLSSYALLGPVFKLYHDLLSGALYNNSENVENIDETILKTLSDTAKKSPVLDKVLNNIDNESEKDTLDDMNNVPAVTLKVLGLSSKSAIISFLKGVSTENNIIFKIIKDCDTVANEAIKTISELENKSDNEADKKYLKALSNMAKVVSRISKYAWSYNSAIMVFISEAIKQKKTDGSQPQPQQQ